MRRWGLIIASLGAVTAAVATVSTSKTAPLEPAQADARRPNVLIVVTDDQRESGTLSVMPHTKRWFAREGTRYTNALATTPTCCPSRSSIMTGLYAHNHGVLTSDAGQALNLDQNLTMQHNLQGDGYRTAIFGKYLNEWPHDVDPPSFDEWAIVLGGNRHYYYDGLWNVHGKMRHVSRYSTRFVEDQALDFLKEGETDDDRPWLLYLTPTSPHLPAIPESRFAHADVPRFRRTPAMLEENRSDKPPEVQAHHANLKLVRENRRNQLRSLLSVDEMVNAVFQRLHDEGELDDTLAIFVGDNGFLWGEHGLTQKIRPYEASVEVPLIVRWPGADSASRSVDDRLVANIDLAPTVFDATGVHPDHAFDGRSLLAEPRDRLVIEQWKRPDRTVPNWAATRTTDYLYVEYYAADRLVPEFREYYDLAVDPWELENLFGDLDLMNDPSNAADLSLQLHRDVTCAGTSGPLACP